MLEIPDSLVVPSRSLWRSSDSVGGLGVVCRLQKLFPDLSRLSTDYSVSSTVEIRSYLLYVSADEFHRTAPCLGALSGFRILIPSVFPTLAFCHNSTPTPLTSPRHIPELKDKVLSPGRVCLHQRSPLHSGRTIHSCQHRDCALAWETARVDM